MDDNLHYRWESELTPEEICARIRTLAKPMDRGWQFKQGGAMYYRFSDDAQVCLGYADLYAADKGKWTRRSHAFFYGTVTEEQGVTVIEGDLCEPREPRGTIGVNLAVVAIFVPLVAAAIGLSLRESLGLVVFCLLVMGLSPIFESVRWGKGWWVPELTSVKENQAVLDLIENNLLKR